MEIPTAPPKVLNDKLGDGCNDAHWDRVPEKAKSSRGCGHVLQGHGGLQGDKC
jgi:hypothetical protein